MGISGNMGQTNGNGNPGYKSIINSHCSEYSLISVARAVWVVVLWPEAGAQQVTVDKLRRMFATDYVYLLTLCVAISHEKIDNQITQQLLLIHFTT